MKTYTILLALSSAVLANSAQGTKDIKKNLRSFTAKQEEEHVNEVISASNIINESNQDQRDLQSSQRFCPKRRGVSFERNIISIDNSVIDNLYVDLFYTEEGEEVVVHEGRNNVFSISDEYGVKEAKFNWGTKLTPLVNITGVELNEFVFVEGSIKVKKRLGCRWNTDKEIFVDFGALTMDCQVCGSICSLNVPLVEQAIEVNPGGCPAQNEFTFDLDISPDYFPKDSGVYKWEGDFSLKGNSTNYLRAKIEIYMDV